MVQVKNSEQLASMRKAGRITGEAILAAREHIKEGISTKELDTIIRNYIEKCGAKPSFLGYGGFPGSACISINNEVIHGIPSAKRFLEEGDIVKIDVGAYIGGFHGDSANVTLYIISFPRSLLSGTIPEMCLTRKKYFGSVESLSFFAFCISL